MAGWPQPSYGLLTPPPGVHILCSGGLAARLLCPVEAPADPQIPAVNLAGQ